MPIQDFGPFVNGRTLRTPDGSEIIPIVKTSVTYKCTPLALALANNVLIVGNNSANNTTSTTFANLDNFALAVGANQIWAVEIVLAAISSATAGGKFKITAPTSAIVNSNIFGNTLSFTTFSSEVQGVNTATANTYCAFATGSQNYGLIRINSIVTTGATTGNVTLQYASGVSGQNFQVAGNLSFLRASRFV